MAQTSGFFDAEESLSGEYDREYVAEQWANYFSLFIGNGVFASPSNQLQVVENSGMTVTVKAGWGWVNGYWYHNDSDMSITIPANQTASAVTDGIFLRFDSSERKITVEVEVDRTAVNRTAPYYELKLAEVEVAAGAIAIAQSAITDTRTNADVCGLVTGLIEVIDGEDFFAQLTSTFNTWFQHMKDQLDTDAAGHLQGEIDQINNAIGDIIDPIEVSIPSLVVSSYDYDGTAKTPSFTNLDMTKVVQKMQAQSFTDAGTYTITCSLKDSKTMIWSDSTTADKEYYFTVKKAENTKTSLSSNSITGTYWQGDTIEITVNNAIGYITAVTDDISVVNVSVSGTSVKVLCIDSGDCTITISDSGDIGYAVKNMQVNVSVIVNKVSNVSWSNGTNEEINLAIRNADLGLLDLYEDLGWRVGDERPVTIGAITSTGTYDDVSWSVGESQEEQTVTMVLMDRGSEQTFDLVDPVKNKSGANRTKPSFIVGIKNSLATFGYMNSSASNSGSWDGSARRGWCNGGFRQAIPDALRGIFKKFKTITAETYDGGTNKISEDFFALFAEKEILGARTYSSTSEAAALIQIEWYKTSANRIKKQGDLGSESIWQWTRSPQSFFKYFCRIMGDSPGAIDANSGQGLSPFGCI